MGEYSIFKFFCMVLIVFVVIGALLKKEGITFNARCKEAGFVGAEHEACVLRMMKGGTMYLENMHLK